MALGLPNAEIIVFIILFTGYCRFYSPLVTAVYKGQDFVSRTVSTLEYRYITTVTSLSELQIRVLRLSPPLASLITISPIRNLILAPSAMCL